VTPELPPPPPPRAETRGAGPRGLAAVAWGGWQALGVYLLGNVVIGQFVVGSVVLVAMGVGVGEPIEGLPQIAASIGADAAFLATMLVWLRWRARDWPSRIGVVFGREGLRDAVIGAVTGLVLYGVIAFAVGVPLLALFRLVFGDRVAPPEQIPEHLSANAKALTAFLALVLAPVTEELFYRGILYRGVRDRHGVALGMLISSVLFGASHLVQAPWRDALFLQTLMVFTGLGLAMIYERRGNLVADVAAHVAFNVVGIVIIFAGR
jgi:membrane protease YdiL (CAAX protease family)